MERERWRKVRGVSTGEKRKVTPGVKEGWREEEVRRRELPLTDLSRTTSSPLQPSPQELLSVI